MTALSSTQEAAPGVRIDPHAMMAIRNLELRARAIVEGFWSGIHRSPYHGFSAEFTEYRQYTAGDDLRYLDWRVFARSDRHFIKKFEDETNVRCHLVVDQSRSMDYGTVGYTKAAYAGTLAATLAYFLHLQGDAVGLLTFDDKVRDYLPARHRTGHLRQLMLALDRSGDGAATDIVAAVDRITGLVRKRGLVALVSDFLAPIEALQPKLVALAACGHEIDVFQVLDPVEVELGLKHATRVQDLETGTMIYVDPERTRDEYRRRLQAHQSALRGMCDRLGAGYHPLSTAEPLGSALLGFLQRRVQRGRLHRRAAGPRTRGGES